MLASHVKKNTRDSSLDNLSRNPMLVLYHCLGVIMKQKLTRIQIQELAELARQARGAILTMTTLSASGHPGGSMSMIDMLITLYKHCKVDPSNPHWEERDRIVVSNGHTSPGVYAALATVGFFPIDDAITGFRLAGSKYEGHIERTVSGVEWGTGNLGQGLSAACGFALASRLKGYENQVYCFMGDGEQQKGQISEARRFAVKYDLQHITAIIDYNRLQISGNISNVMPQNIRANWESDGWTVLEINGHDFQAIHEALEHAKTIKQPVMILAHTIMGKGVPFMENKEKYHGSTLSEEQLAEALTILQIDNKLSYYKEKRAKFACTSHTPILAHELRYELADAEPTIYEKSTDNRSAWGRALANLAKANTNSSIPMVVFDCDLQGSVKTNEFEDVTPTHFIQSGIMEHNTAVVAGVLSVENIQTFWAEFGVFGIDETYNMHRLTDINQGNLKVVATHVGLDVGEDGKTHQCLDYVGLMRNLYGFRVIVPADPNQTDHAVRYMGVRKGNYLMAMGRSKLDIIRKVDGSPYYDANYTFAYGKADLLRDYGNDAAVLVMGTLTGEALNATEALQQKETSIQLWHVACPLHIDEEMLRKAAKTGLIVTVEDHNVQTGLGSLVAEKLVELGLAETRLVKLGVSNYALSGTSTAVFACCGLTAAHIEKAVLAR